MISGVVNFLKPPGMTSHDAVAVIRRIYGQKRVGHSGTLDPAAAGVLPVYLGYATRLIEYADNFAKTYRAEILFGTETDTGDDTGTVRRSQTIGPSDLERLPETITTFLGGYDQVPPMYSALKFQGKKLYELAREGREIERSPRRIDISSIILLWLTANKAGFEATCSKGTYIRTLCTDIGAKLGLPATMGFLLRTRVGPFELNTSRTLEEITENPSAALLPADIAVLHLAACQLNAAEACLLQQGRSISLTTRDQGAQAEWVRLYSDGIGFFGIGRLTAGSDILQPIKIFRNGIGYNADH